MATIAKINDSVLWQRVCGDDPDAFEELVKRHQSAVSAVAYNACGDLALSEDISQETFLTAWKNRLTLRDANRIKSWFCGIARNLARNTARRASKLPQPLDAFNEPVTHEPEPLDEAVSREEEVLLWQALSEIDETYREPLILFYRDDQSVVEVAAALDITTDTAKQRLSRGRAQLREQIAVMVENALLRTRPNKTFTIAVMTGLTAMATGAKAAATGGTLALLKSASVDAGVAAVTKAAGAASGTLSAGTIGTMTGVAGGILGGWLGTWLPAQFAPTKTQRDFQLRAGRRILMVSINWSLVLFLGLLMLAATLADSQRTAAIFGWIMVLNLYIAIEIWWQIRGVVRIQKTVSPQDDPNDARLKRFVESQASRYEGRVYRSRATLLGIPLIDINVGGEIADESGAVTRRRACGWIAVGNRADGVLLAIGDRARGAVALGGVAIGLVSLGGFAVGLLSFGGVAIGAMAFGGTGIAAIALGGLAVGWQAMGGLAVAWDTACGGAAVAHHAAFGGWAMARELAMGGSASALHANDAVAKEFFDSHWLLVAMKWQLAHHWMLTAGIVSVSILVPLGVGLIMYRRKPTHVSA